MSTLLQRQIEAVQRTIMNKNRAHEEMVAEVLNLVAEHYARIDASAMELTTRANEAYERLNRALGGPPPLPDSVNSFLDEMMPQQERGYTQ